MRNPHPSSVKSSRAAGNILGLRGLALGLVLLGVCVFAWGLRYKLSLYDPPQSISRHMPAAKLLSGKKQMAVPAANEGPTSSVDSLAFLLNLSVIALFVLAGLKLWPGTLAWAQRRSQCRCVPGAARVLPSFVRPPPRLS